MPPGRPRKITAASLERIAVHHLQRYSTSSANLRRVLRRRVERAAKAHAIDASAWLALVDELIPKLERAGLLDDARFAHSRAQSLHGRGASLRAIAFKLKARGVAAPQVREALGRLEEDHEDPDLAAAFALARRRRLGPFRRAEERQARREKDLAALVRAGFPFAIARRVMQSEPPDAG